jgi:hypothetical protein
MLFDLLAVFVVTLISSFVFSTTSVVHGYPSSAPSNLHYIPLSPSADLSSSLRFVPSMKSDSDGDALASMFDDDAAESPTLRSRKLFRLFKQLEQEEKHRKRSSSTSKQSKPNSALAAWASSAHGGSRVNLNHASDSIPLSPSLKILVKNNPLLQTWLAMLLEKLLEEKSAPYIFKYGRRRK